MGRSAYAVEFEMNGRTHELLLDFITISNLDRRLEQSYGYSFMTGAARMGAGQFNLALIIDCFHEGLKHAEHTLPRTKVERMINEAVADPEQDYNLPKLAELIVEAAQKAGIFPTLDEEDEKDEEKDSAPLAEKDG